MRSYLTVRSSSKGQYKFFYYTIDRKLFESRFLAFGATCHDIRKRKDQTKSNDKSPYTNRKFKQEAQRATYRAPEYNVPPS